MKQLLRISCLFGVFFWLMPAGVTVAAGKGEVAFSGSEYRVVAENDASICLPGHAPFYLFNHENSSAETIIDYLRVHYLLLPAGRMVPPDFYFQRSLCVTFYLNSQKGTVPLFIWGHALLC